MTTNNDEKKLLEKMRDLLLSGARMLGEACPKCGTPLFLIKEVGLKYCPKCNVYVATPDEIEKAKIDKSRLKIYDFDAYWASKEEEKEEAVPKTITEEKEVRKKAETIEREKVIEKQHILDALDELILTLIEKITLLIDRNFQKADPKELLGILREIIKIRKEL